MWKTNCLLFLAKQSPFRHSIASLNNWYIMTLTSTYFFDLSKFAHRSLFQEEVLPWTVLLNLIDYLQAQPLGLHHGEISPAAYLVKPDLISIGEGSVVEPGAYIQGPCVIGKRCVIRHGAYVRGNVLTGDHCVIGHDTEVKHAIFLDHAHAAHFAYVGDSILGNHVNLGAGTKCANFKLDQSQINVRVKGNKIATNMRKLGAIIGDNTQIGCNSVTNPGTLIGQDVKCYPCLNVEGFIPTGATVKPAAKPVIETRTDKS